MKVKNWVYCTTLSRLSSRSDDFAECTEKALIAQQQDSDMSIVFLSPQKLPIFLYAVFWWHLPYPKVSTWWAWWKHFIWVATNLVSYIYRQLFTQVLYPILGATGMTALKCMCQDFWVANVSSGTGTFSSLCQTIDRVSGTSILWQCRQVSFCKRKTQVSRQAYMVHGQKCCKTENWMCTEDPHRGPSKEKKESEGLSPLNQDDLLLRRWRNRMLHRSYLDIP